jgi:hypothetical protein
MQVLQSVTVAIALGALIAAWAVAHFNEGLPPEEIRFSVTPQRYFVALGAHVSAIFAAYGLLTLLIYQVLMSLAGEGPPRACFQFTFSEPCKTYLEGLKPLKSDVLVWSALASVLFIQLVLPNTPIVRRVLDRLRDLTRELALFPLARQRLVALLSGSSFTVRMESDRELSEELGRYGVAPKWLSFLSRGACLSLLEVFSVRRRLLELCDSSERFASTLQESITFFKNALFATEPNAGRSNGLVHALALGRFKQARAASLAQLETNFRRLLRRTALSLRLVEDVGETVESKALCRAVSNFIAEECEDVLAHQRRILAETSLSCVRTRAERAEFLRSFGYYVSLPPALPLWPWLIVFVLDLLLFLIPLLVMRFQTRGADLPTARLALFACVHAISQSVALTWAIWPKIRSNFARPSPYSLPWQSYALFGLASYLTGAVILFMFRLTLAIPFPIFLPTLLSSLSFLLMTVGISFRIDRRLQLGSFDFEHGRTRDGVFMALLMLAGTVTFQVVIFVIGPKVGWVAPSPIPLEPLVPPVFLALSAFLGFIMGYFVPSATAAFLQRANSPAAVPFDKRRIVLVHHSTASWETRVSTPA